MERALIPGSNWLYFKIYTGKKSADHILIDMIKSYVDCLLVNGNISEYFFLRYTDPGFHIRVRLKLTGFSVFNNVMNYFYKYFNDSIENGLIYKIQIDTYERELERYGESTMELIETLFYIDSYSIINFLKLLRENGDSDKDRWLIAMNLVDDLLTAAAYDLKQKSDFLEFVSANFKKEFNMNSVNYTKQLNGRYRTERMHIEKILRHNGMEYSVYHDILEDRKNQIQLILRQLADHNNVFVRQIMPSLTHMTLNRLFRDNGRLCEMVIYYFMSKYYYSEICKIGNEKNSIF